VHPRRQALAFPRCLGAGEAPASQGRPQAVAATLAAATREGGRSGDVTCAAPYTDTRRHLTTLQTTGLAETGPHQIKPLDMPTRFSL
jgi:hypothetical protein